MDLQQNPNNGQVHLETDFGKALYLLAAVPTYKTFCEVGTWKGNGTTRCVIEGLLHRINERGSQDVHFWSAEANKTFYTTARELWEPHALPFLHLLYGKLHTDGLMTATEIESHPYFAHVVTHYQLWYKHDVVDYLSAPLIRQEHLPPTIDVLILDGGEFCGYADWLALKGKHPKVVCLDDTGVMKNERVFKELKADPNWILRAESADRHGWAIFERRAEVS